MASDYRFEARIIELCGAPAGLPLGMFVSPEDAVCFAARWSRPVTVIRITDHKLAETFADYVGVIDLDIELNKLWSMQFA